MLIYCLDKIFTFWGYFGCVCELAIGFHLEAFKGGFWCVLPTIRRTSFWIPVSVRTHVEVSKSMGMKKRAISGNRFCICRFAVSPLCKPHFDIYNSCVRIYVLCMDAETERKGKCHSAITITTTASSNRIAHEKKIPWFAKWRSVSYVTKW